MVKGSANWWDDPSTDWTRGEPLKAVQLLAWAYEDSEGIRRITDAAGIPWDSASDATAGVDRWRAVLVEAASRGSVLDLVAEVLQDAGSNTFHPVLVSLLGDRIGEVNARRALRHGLPPQSDDTMPLIESLVRTPSPSLDQPQGTLEAITAVSGGLDDAHALTQALVDASLRTAMIEVAGRPQGTGFLVGPDLLLTAAHVLDARSWPPQPRRPVRAVFDYVPTPGRSPAEVGVRVDVVDHIAGSLPSDDEVAGTVGVGDAPADRLDFALLRLAHPPPILNDRDRRSRGYYSLDESEYDFSQVVLLRIVQHPLGDFQKVTEIITPPRLSATGTRILYRGNTLRGSSGSAVVDRRGRLVALHHYSQAGSNQGVPVSLIARELLRGPHSHLVDGAASALAAAYAIDPFVTTSLLGRPLVNRANLRTRLREMAQQPNGARTLAITGERGSGVSYSYRLTSYVAERSRLCPPLQVAAPEGLVAFKVDLRDYVAFGVEERRSKVIQAVLVGLGLVPPLAPLAQEARTVHAMRLAVAAHLRGSQQQWWIFFDSIDDLVAVKQGQVDEVVRALIDIAEDAQVTLRIVLAGREAEAFAHEHAASLEEDVTVGLGRSDVERWFRARAAEEQCDVDEARLQKALVELFPPGAPLPEPRRLAARLPARLHEVLGAGHDPGS